MTPVDTNHALGKQVCFLLIVDEAGFRLEDDGRIEIENEIAAIHDGRELLSAIVTLQEVAAFLERDGEAAAAVVTIRQIAKSATPRCEMLLGRLRARNDRSAHRLIGAIPLRARHVGGPTPAGTLKVANLAVPSGKLR